MEMTGKWTQIVRQHNIEISNDNHDARLANITTKMLREKRTAMKQEAAIIEADDYDDAPVLQDK